MLCPNCNSPDTRVIDSRTSKDNQSIRRRRECSDCGHRFTTLEEIIRDGLLVLKKDGSTEDFSQAKLMGSLGKALEKRPVETERIHVMVNELIRVLEKAYDDRIPSEAIAAEVIRRLRPIDEIAWVRYSAGYKHFVEA
ncbi:MAG: Transcriptional repressor NrdR [Verrucomicrobia bacterium ADurb.Bin474]|nr:MAG: Transcriptional repressor NrdR [Verrucomicrobia bacterium ADurb.Bin474]